MKYLFFFFKQKTAYEIGVRLVGSEMCIRDRIRGWANYHRHIVAKDTFQKLDSYLWEISWQWGKRRHPNKGHKWIANKYWTSEGTRNWIFQTKETKLLKFLDTKIRRHHHAKLDANPY